MSNRPSFLLERFLLFIALGIALYLGWHSLQASPVPGCGPESDCDRVLESRWAWMFGLPVSLWAAPVYGGMLLLLWRKQVRWEWVSVLAGVILVAGVYFISVQAFAVKAWCKFCMVAHGAGMGAAIALSLRSFLSVAARWKAIGTGAAAAGLVFAAQAVADVGSELPMAAQVTHTNEVEEIASRAGTLKLLDGAFELDLEKLPVSGSIESSRRVVKLFDYTCHHCRELHHLLKEYQKTEAIAVISLPMPLDSTCNRYVRKTPRAHLNACEYARIGMAVFYAERERYEQFNDWIFEPPTPPELTEAMRHAGELVGKDVLADALKDPRIDRQINETIELFAANSRLGKGSAMPQMLFSTGTSIGAVRSMSQLQTILNQHLPTE